MKRKIKKYKVQKFKILQRGNFYFPYIDKEKKFIVGDTLELEIDRRKFVFLERLEKIGKLKRFRNYKQVYFGEYAEPIWNELRKLVKNKKEYKNCWFVPIRFVDRGKKNISVSIDVLTKTN